jgi:hypothetical protein
MVYRKHELNIMINVSTRINNFLQPATPYYLAEMINEGRG